MNASDVPEIERALDSVLGALIAHRKQARAAAGLSAPPTPSPQTPEPAAVVRSRDHEIIELLGKDPVDASLRRSVRWLGTKLDEVGGVDQMKATMETVAKAGGDQYDARITICNARWSGVSDWRAQARSQR